MRGLKPCTLSLKCQPPDSCQPFQTQLLLASGPLLAATGAALTKAQATALGRARRNGPRAAHSLDRRARVLGVSLQMAPD